MGYYGWKPYVRVAQRQAKALKKIKTLRKKGMNIQPIELENRKISTTFWGKSWCKHIESFSDYENRLPRGRTYVRNGSVCHLSIEKGKISAIVVGSYLYNIEIDIQPLPLEKWLEIKKKCSGQIGSILELLSGQLSDSVMNVVCHQKQGLFPLQGEINISCSCPDWASMCKHVAAVLYGVSSRLDRLPEQLFLLRGVNHEELIDISASISKSIEKGKSTSQRIADSSLEDVFGIEMENKPCLKTASSKEKTSSLPSRLKRKAIKSRPENQLKTLPFTGENIRNKRKSLGLSQAALAKTLGVSSSRISQWESNGSRLFHPKTTVKKKWDNLNM
jgi:uncharacterized Zn finger protein